MLFIAAMSACKPGIAQTPDWLWAIGSIGGGYYQYGLSLAAANTSNDIYLGGRIAGSVTLGGVPATAAGAATVFSGRFNSAGVFSWIATAPYSGGFDYVEGFSVDKSDNVYNTGIISSGSGIYMTRHNSAGTQTWSTTYAGGSGYGLAADDAGDMYAIGVASGNITFGSTTLSSGSYLVKFNNAGTAQWAVRSDASVRSIVLDNKGNIYTCGGYSGTPVFGSITAPASSGYANLYVAKYDAATGNALWVATAGSAGFPNGSGIDHRAAMTIDTTGNLYVTGYYRATAQFGPFSLTSAGGQDVFIGKLLNNGTWEWVRSAGGTSDDYAGEIKTDKDFDIYVTGAFQGTAQFGSQSIASVGAQDIFVAKYASSTGDLQWVQKAGGSNGEAGSGIAVDADKFVYVTGSYSNNCTFGAYTISTAVQGAVYVAKLDTVPDRKIIPQLSAYCTGAAKPLPFTIKGTFNAGNVFTAQLSDANGSFVTPQNIGTLTGTTGGVINITIPPGTVPGSTYRIRILSSNPVYSSNDNKYITITGPCAPVILNGDSTALDTIHCYADVNKEILGVPGGGTFSGCGVVSSGGKWYFNPSLAAAGAVAWPYQCPVVYRLPGGDSARRTMTVQEPVVVHLGRDTAGCAGDTFTLQSSVHYTGAAYQWSTGAVAPSIRVGVSGTYWLDVTMNGCTERDSIAVMITPRPDVQLGNDTGICDRDMPLTLSSPQAAGTQYLWSTGLTTSSIDVTRTDTYWLEATLGDCKGSDTITVKVIPTPSIHIGNDSFICEGMPAEIGDAVPGAAYLWNTGSTSSSITVSESGSYWLTTDLERCKVSDTVLITVTPLPAPNLGPDSDICPEQVIVLDASYAGGSYRWSTGDTASSLSVSAAGTYSVQVRSAYGCTGSDTVTFSYYPLPVVSLGSDTVVCEETPLVLNPFYTNSDSLRWSDGSGGSSLTITEGGVYIVTGINKCGETHDTVEIKQIFCDIWVPNAFTPNGDGVNDLFRVLGNTGRLESFRLRVFNRWGQLLFETSDRTKGWDGRQQGGEAQLGAYVYMLEYSLKDRPVLQKGNFTLLR